MEKPIVYGILLSPPVRCVLLTVKAIGLDFDFKEVSCTNDQHLSKEYLKKNPQHTVPTLEDGGKFIWDSHAISTYLVNKYGKNDSLYPRDLYEQARVDQRLHFDSGVLFPVLKDTIIQLLRMNRSHVDDRTVAKVFEGYDFLEKFLEEGDFMVGNSVTIADFSCVTTITTMNVFYPIDGVKYPKILKWIERMSKLPYFASVNPAGIEAFIKLVGSKAPASIQ